MPCRDHYGEAEERRERQEQQARLDQLTRMLCDACTLLEQQDLLHHVSQETQEWWKTHKARDEVRRQQEAMKESEIRRLKGIVRNLSAADRKLLERNGLKVPN